MEFTLILGAHSTAKVLVRFTRPPFAAPYAALPGVGLVAVTLEIFVITHPDNFFIIFLAT